MRYGHISGEVLFYLLKRILKRMNYIVISYSYIADEVYFP